MAVEYQLSLTAALFLLSVLTTALVRKWLMRRAILDHPNERSSHTLSTPRGGGIAVVGIIAAAWSLYAGAAPTTILACALGLALISWLDDRYGLSAGLRLVVHLLAVGGAIASAPHVLTILPVPAYVVAGAVAFCWIYFINVYNFMDGIDGITGVETLSICIGLLIIDGVWAGSISGPALPLLIAAACGGFLVWNWHPAKIFLGDVGSIPLGFLLGYLLLDLAASGQAVAALILCSYYLTDASVTLAGRLWRRENIFQAHRQHFYQRALTSGMTHDGVVLRIAFANVVLLGFAALAASGRPSAALAGAALTVAALLFVLSRPRRP